ncbi:MAG: PA14 domain-containing protein [Candidatus Asgardarchaeia archaeon]
MIWFDKIKNAWRNLPMRRVQALKFLTIVMILFLLSQASAVTYHYLQNTESYSSNTSSNNKTNAPYPVFSNKFYATWWNLSWHYRLSLNVTFSYSSQFNISTYVVVNFTKEMESVSAGNKTIDPNSIRVVEYDPQTGDVIAEVPSKFIPFSGWNATANATGVVLFLVTAPINSGEVRTYHIYFDTTYFGVKSPPNYSSVSDEYWEQFYPVTGGSYSTADAVQYKTPPYLERFHNKIYYTDNPSYSGDPFPSQIGTTDYFGGNWTTWLYINRSGLFTFRLYSDDGSWLFINDTELINNGGLHSPRSVTQSIYLKEGIYKLTVKWYENGGTALIHLYWTYPGRSETLLTTSISAFSKAKYMDYANPPNRVIWKTEASFALFLTVVDKSNLPVESTQVLLYNVTGNANTLLYSTTTNRDGLAILSVSVYGDYMVIVKNETAYPTWSSEKIWVSTNFTFTVNETNIHSRVEKTVTLPLSTIDLLVTDLNGNPMKANPNEVTGVLLYNMSYVNLTGNYIPTNASGYVRFYRLPSDNYTVGFTYTTYIYGKVYNEAIMGRRTFSAMTSGVRTVKVRLTDLNVRVVSVDDKPIPSANVKIENIIIGTPFIYYNDTLDSGIATFYRVLNGTWNVSVTFKNAWGQSISNDSNTFDIQSDVPHTVVLNVTDLYVYVIDQNTLGALPNSNVTIFEVNAPTQTISLSTNSSGYSSFYFVLAGTYNISANYQGNKQTTTATVLSSTVVTVKILVQYLNNHTYLFALSDAFHSVYWNDNITLLVNYSYYYNQMYPIVNPDWLNFTVYMGSTVIYSASTLDSSPKFIINNNNGTYTLLINTSQLSMYPSSTYYSIVVEAKYTNQTTESTPSPLLFTVNVLASDTNLHVAPSTLQVNWTGTLLITLNYTDQTHGYLPIANANVTYYIYNYSHYLLVFNQITSATNIYTINIPSETYGLVPGKYIVEIYVGKRGYVNKTFSGILTVVKAPTSMSILTSPTIIVTWGNQVTVRVRYYNLVNSSSISNSMVDLFVNNTYLCTLMYDTIHGTYNATFNSSVLFSGTYYISIHASHEFFEPASTSLLMTVKPMPIHFVLVNVEKSYNVTWSDVVTLSFYIRTNTTLANITSAKIVAEWNPTNYLINGYYNDTLSLYFVTLNTTQVFAGSYNVTITAMLTNYTTISMNISINVSEVPTNLQCVDSIEVVWGEFIYVEVQYADTYHNTGVNDAVVFLIVNGQYNMMNVISNGTYSISIRSDELNPGIYTFTVFAQRSNYVSQTKTIMVTILAPIQMTAERITGYWGTQVPVVVNVTNTINGSYVANGTVILSVGTVQVQLNDIGGNGTYVGLLDLSLFKSETLYDVNITFYKELYEQATITTTLYVNLVPTSLTIVSVHPSTETIVEGEFSNITIIVNYTNSLTREGITGANVTAVALNRTFTLTELGNGQYKLVIDISNLTFSPNPYIIKIFASKGNYTISSTVYSFTISESRIIGIPRSIFITGVGGSIISMTLLGVALYAYRLYKVPWILRAIDKAIKSVVKGKPVTFEKFPDLTSLLEEEIAPLFSSGKARIPRKTTE